MVGEEREVSAWDYSTMDEARLKELVDGIVERRITEAVQRLEAVITKAMEKPPDRPAAEEVEPKAHKGHVADAAPRAADSPLRTAGGSKVSEVLTTSNTLVLNKEEWVQEPDFPELPGMPLHPGEDRQPSSPAQSSSRSTTRGRSLFGRAASFESEDARGRAMATMTADDLERRRRMRKTTSTLTAFDAEKWPRLAAAMKTAQVLLASTKVELAFFACIVVSSGILGLQIELESLGSTTEELDSFFFSVGILFCSVFVSELLLRILANGNVWNFFFVSDSRILNNFDTLVVLLSIVEISGGMNVRSIRVLRVFRVLRAVRVLMIVGTIRSLAWAMVLLWLLIFIFSCIFTDATTFYKSGTSSASISNTDPQFYFPSLHWSMYVLFSTIAGGQSWSRVFDAISAAGWGWAWLFCGFISFSLFAVMNVMTGMFCQAAMASAERDQELQIARISENRESLVQDMERVFMQMGNDKRADSITLTMLEAALEDEAFKNFFTSLDMNVASGSEAWSLFKLLDRDGDFTIDLDEFVDGCLRLRGDAKAVDVASLKWEVKAQSKQLKELQDHLKELAQALVESNVLQPAGEEDTLLR